MEQTTTSRLPGYEQQHVDSAHPPPTNNHTHNPDDDDDEEQAEEDGQYPRPMNDPFAEIEGRWREASSKAPSSLNSQLPHSNEHLLNQLGHFSFSNNPHPAEAPKHAHPSFNPPLSMNLLSMRRADHQPPLFRPPSSASANKNSFSSTDLALDHLPRTRLSSFSTELEPISASPTSPNSPYTFSTDHHIQPQQQHYQPPPASNPPRASRVSLPTSQWPPLNLSSSSSSSFSSSDDGLLLRRASSSSLASVASVASSTNGLKARRGLTKPLSLSLAVPQANNSNHHHHQQQSNVPQALATPLRARHETNSSNNNINSKTSVFSRSLPPSPRLGDLGQARAQFVGIKANVTGGLSMKRRTSIPRLSLGGISSTDTSRGYDPVRLIGRNNESVMNTPVQLHFDPVAAGEGRQELMSSQAGVGGKGHIEVPSELTETFPYEYGPKEVLPDVFLGSEQNARDGNLLSSMGFGLIINVAKEVECPWEPTSSPAPIEHLWPTPLQQQQQPRKRGLMVRPTASTPNLKRSFEGKIRVSLPEQPSPHHHYQPASSSSSSPFQMKRLDADRKTSRPSLDYIKLPWSHDQDGLAEIFNGSEVFALIDRARERRLKTLVHCQCGVSRSATFVIGYCMREAVFHPDKLQLSGRMHDAYSFVKEKSPWAGPNMGLIYQLIEYEKVLSKARRDVVEEEDEEEEAEEEDEGRGRMDGVDEAGAGRGPDAAGERQAEGRVDEEDADSEMADLDHTLHNPPTPTLLYTPSTNPLDTLAS
ncbi:hypothetical protein PTTG_27306 [Puccinia triticina 1-1 BBBD Race 1]|uniref:protein-tyrosine-phosphatase n=1 Tax=Puccinia triticina (isolate 1-1 / race 1 (BBBD)) TaxID=630390 RepID=A0A180GM32_PUCT1|nr:hypothetical protein PTTG_27306 [Puccinia triticina 1-1 BBBD Race 1]